MSIDAIFPLHAVRPPAAGMLQPLAAAPDANRNAYDLETAVIFSREASLQALIEKGVPVTTPDPEGYLMLSFAVVHNRREILALLLAHGADPLKVDAGGLCPLELAEALGYDVAVDVFLEHLGVAPREATVLAA